VSFYIKPTFDLQFGIETVQLF